MKRQFCIPFWVKSVFVFLAVVVKSGAVENEEILPRQCYQCPFANSSACEVPPRRHIICPPDEPYCATNSFGPNFTSTLSCSAETERPCALISSNSSFNFTCVCKQDLCNKPFSKALLQQLHFFSLSTITKHNTSTDLTENFLKQSKFSNISQKFLFKSLTEEFSTRISTQGPRPSIPALTATTTTAHTTLRHSEAAPRAEAQKQIPSDDDEDDSEGSGFEEIRSDRRPAAAPERPSSFLPASDNKAGSVVVNLSAISLCLCVLHSTL